MEFLIIAAILFCGGLAFGLGTRPWFALPLACMLAIVAGIRVGDWSGYRTMFSRWDVFFYACSSILGYFVLVTCPALIGAVTGTLVRRSFPKSHKNDSA